MEARLRAEEASAQPESAPVKQSAGGSESRDSAPATSGFAEPEPAPAGEVDSRPDAYRFATPLEPVQPLRSEVREGRSENEVKPIPANAAEPALLSFEALKKEEAAVSQSVPKTDRLTEIRNAVPEWLTKGLGELPTPSLLMAVSKALGDTPIERFAARIEIRREAFTSLGLLERVAKDVAGVWREERVRTAAREAEQERRIRAQTAAAEVELRERERFERMARANWQDMDEGERREWRDRARANLKKLPLWNRIGEEERNRQIEEVAVQLLEKELRGGHG